MEKGIARTYYYKDGKDITYWIATENDFVGSMASFFMRTSSNKFVETLENCIFGNLIIQNWEAIFIKSRMGTYRKIIYKLWTFTNGKKV